MDRSSQQSRRYPLLLLPLFAGILLGSASACARPAATTQPAPEAEPETEAEAATTEADSVEEGQSSAADLTSSEVRKRRRTEDLVDMLRVRTPGVRVAVNPDGSISVQVRGVSSFLSSNAPLVLIDGTPVRLAPGGRLRGINPYDIESIEVLKNPADIALYGVRGANGVILITTLRPTK